MGEASLNIRPGVDKAYKEETPEEVYKRIKSLLRKPQAEELVISLCGFIGVDLHGLASNLKSLLQDEFQYEVEIIKLSSFIREHAQAVKNLPADISHYDSFRKFIEGSNELREKKGHSILAELAIQKISFNHSNEKNIFGDIAVKSRSKCYIIDSLKNNEELVLLKLVYGDMHYSISVSATMENRSSYLRVHKNMTEAEIYSLIDPGVGEELKHSKGMIDTFIQSDFFLRVDTEVNKVVDQKLERFVHLIFGSKLITPTDEETTLYRAANAVTDTKTGSGNMSLLLHDGAAPSRYKEWFPLPAERNKGKAAEQAS